ncbi:hypothetical protein [uncultured Sphaerochaeta sp.]|uniref:hypothetical protein n=1 Tax=uncultured Sphaerochaeta sp. TaxID=886478 RepID=UPI0029CA1E36|nr:hypothetical protein [uncultured Sphaerochaeta sp.]
MTNKPLLPLIFIIIVLLMGCTSTSRDERVSAVEAENALREVTKLASQAVDANLFTEMGLQDLLPQNAAHFVEMEGIPLFLDHLDRWQTQVQQAFRSVLVQTTLLVEDSSNDVVWENPEAALVQGNQSATRELTKQRGDVIREEVLERLKDALASSNETWNVILDRYSIWQKGTSLWGEEVLVEVKGNPFDHLSTQFLETYFKELGRQEEILRTTPVPRGSGSFLELFWQDA